MTTASLCNCSKNTIYWFLSASNRWYIQTHRNTGNQVCKNFDQDTLTTVIAQTTIFQSKITLSVSTFFPLLFVEKLKWSTHPSINRQKNSSLSFIHIHPPHTHCTNAHTAATHSLAFWVTTCFLPQISLVLPLNSNEITVSYCTEWDSTRKAQQFFEEETIWFNRSLWKSKKLQNHIAIYSVAIYNTETFSRLLAEAPPRGHKLHRHSFPGGAQGKILTIRT